MTGTFDIDGEAGNDPVTADRRQGDATAPSVDGGDGVDPALSGAWEQLDSTLAQAWDQVDASLSQAMERAAPTGIPPEGHPGTGVHAPSRLYRGPLPPPRRGRPRGEAASIDLTDSTDVGGPGRSPLPAGAGEAGYLSDARVELPRRGTGRRRRREAVQVPIPSIRRTVEAPPPGVDPRHWAEGIPGPLVAVPDPPSKWGLIIPLIILVVSLSGLGYLALSRSSARGIASPLAGDPGATATVGEPVPPAATAATALFVLSDADGAQVGFTVVSLPVEGDPLVVFIPGHTLMEVPGFGLEPLTAASDLGGPDLTRLAVENLLTIRFDQVVEFDPNTLANIVGGLGPVTVDNPGRVDRRSESDRVQVIYPTGPVTLAPGDLARFMVSRGLNETELDGIVRRQEAWKAVLAARSTVAGRAADPAANLDDLLDALALRAGDIEYRILDVTSLGGDSEIYGVDRSALPGLIDRLAPERMVQEKPRIRVQILNGVGRPGIAPAVTELLIGAGATVELVDNASTFDHETTQVVYYRDDQIDAAVAVLDALGTGELVKQLEPLDVVDVTVVVGSDLVSRLESGSG